MDDWDLNKIYSDPYKVGVEKLYKNKAPLTAEFLKIVCISIGWIDFKGTQEELEKKQDLIFKTKSFFGDNEPQILKSFYAATKSVLDKPINPTHYLVAYNGLTFDIPVLAKRFIIDELSLPPMFDLDSKKEWNIDYVVDPKNSWKMTSFDGAASLALLCEVLGVPSPKGDIDGSQVRDVYYVEKDIARIARYCEQDVYRLCQCVLKLKGLKNNLELS